MKRKTGLALIIVAASALGGCIANAALAAAELARYAPQPERPSNAHLAPAATQACSQRAGQYGTVHILDVEQRRVDRLVIWGSVTDARQVRRTFECHFSTRLISFTLREIGDRR